jgi:exopolyphosphatase/guanosine-5'-triphosphate,3'-diphosphate pyrophosphatase
MKNENRVVAILEIGSTGIRLLAAEIHQNNSWHILDRASKPISLGRDVFTSDHVSRESFLECLMVLQDFNELIRGWGVEKNDIHVIATSAIRVAKNRDMIIDRIQQETGFRVTIVEGIEENRLMYLAVRYALRNDLSLFWKTNSCIIEVGGGSTEIMLLRRWKVAAAHSVRLVTILVDQQSRLAMGSAIFHERYIQEHVRTTTETLKSEMDLSYVRSFVAIGGDARIVAAHIGKSFNENTWIIERAEFIKFYDSIKNYSAEECVQKFQMTYADAEGFITAIFIYKLFLEKTVASKIVVPNVSIREGLLINLASQVGSELQDEFFSQIIASAMNLGRKYHYDEAHNRHVAKFALTIFDALKSEHGMDARDRMLMEIAATLHDIGMFVRSSAHHKHGQYIVSHAEIFGLHGDELAIVANVIGHHRGEMPLLTDLAYMTLQREERILVLKMTSILRVADALDRGHSQQIKNIFVERKVDTVNISAEGAYDLSMEKLGLEEKGDMFQDVFGYKILLTHAG